MKKQILEHEMKWGTLIGCSKLNDYFNQSEWFILAKCTTLQFAYIIGSRPNLKDYIWAISTFESENNVFLIERPEQERIKIPDKIFRTQIGVTEMVRTKQFRSRVDLLEAEANPRKISPHWGQEFVVVDETERLGKGESTCLEKALFKSLTF